MDAGAELRVPADLRAAAARYGQAAWLDALPGAVAEGTARWSLTVGAPFEPGGQTAWVAPARSPEHGAVVLKVGFRHPEGEHEADALRVWGGDGAIRVHDAATVGTSRLLLLERCVPGTVLWDRVAEPEQDEVLAGLLVRLWVEPPPGHRFRPLREMCDLWADACEARGEARSAGIDPGLARAGIALFRELPRAADREVLLCTDLHGGNVLAAEREPWLVIDPKPYTGDPTYDALQHLVNCEGRLVTDPHALVRRFAGLLDLDPDRLLTWLFARCVVDPPDWPGVVDLVRRIAPA